MIFATSKWRQQVMMVRGVSLMRPLSSKSFTPDQEEWLIAKGYAIAVKPDRIVTSLPENPLPTSEASTNSAKEEDETIDENDDKNIEEEDNEQDNEAEITKSKRSPGISKSARKT
ncbi:MAG: hypothetical protein KME11_04985 [Timaviella obliquedivisa GSE-PSE-MK23-08B]|jgi:hypothetical protein|nr:hypothetical protein [Timaviella obliquedivisa GSE-PSE-MK23-08B]